MPRRIMFLSIITVTILAVSGCGSKVIKSGDVTVEQKGDSYTYTDTDSGARVEINTLKLPDNFPKDVPVADDAVVKTSFMQDAGFSLGYTTKLAVPDAWSYYQKNLLANGWKVTFQQNQDNSYTSSWEKNNLSMLVTISQDGGQTAISLIASKQ